MKERVYPFNIIEYNVEVDDNLASYNVSYTNEKGQIRKIEKVQGNWRKLIVVPNNQIPIHLSTISLEKLNAPMEANIFVDGKLLQEDISKIGIVNLLSIKK